MPDSVVELVPSMLVEAAPLLPTLRSPKAGKRLVALKALLKLGPAGPEVYTAVQRLLCDGDRAVREAAMLFLVGYGLYAIDELTVGLNHHCKYVRRQCVWGLGKLGPQAIPALKPLMTSLKDSDPRTAAGAAQAIGAIGRDAADAIPELTAAMRGTNVVLCRMASKALSQIGTPAILPLLNNLNHHDPFVCGEAALALGWMGDTASVAVPRLMQLIAGWQKAGKFPSSAPRHGSNDHAVTPPAKDPVWSTEEVAGMHAIEALGRIGRAAADALPLLSQLTQMNPGRLRETARLAIGQITEP